MRNKVKHEIEQSRQLHEENEMMRAAFSGGLTYFQFLERQAIYLRPRNGRPAKSARDDFQKGVARGSGGSGDGRYQGGSTADQGVLPVLAGWLCGVANTAFEQITPAENRRSPEALDDGLDGGVEDAFGDASFPRESALSPRLLTSEASEDEDRRCGEYKCAAAIHPARAVRGLVRSPHRAAALRCEQFNRDDNKAHDFDRDQGDENVEEACSVSPKILSSPSLSFDLWPLSASSASESDSDPARSSPPLSLAATGETSHTSPDDSVGAVRQRVTDAGNSCDENGSLSGYGARDGDVSSHDGSAHLPPASVPMVSVAHAEERITRDRYRGEWATARILNNGGPKVDWV